MKQTIIFLFFLVSAATLSAQQFLDRYTIQDTTMKTVIEKKMTVLKLFAGGKLDSLYFILGSDSTVVHRDTLGKYYRLYTKSHSCLDDGSNPVTWNATTGVNQLTRSFVGMTLSRTGSDVNNGALEMRVDFKILNGEVKISHISFKEVPVSPEVKKLIIDSRAARMKKNEDKLEEESKKEVKKLEQEHLNKSPKKYTPR